MKHVVKIVGVVALVLGATYGCKKEEGATTISFGTAIMGYVNRSYYGDDERRTKAYVEVDGTRLVPVVTINDDTLKLGYYYSWGEYGWYSEWSKDKCDYEPGKELKLKVYHSDGTAEATVTLPGDFEITSPSEDDTLHQNKDLNISWDEATGADYYEICISIWYDYRDTSGYEDWFDFDTTIEQTGTSVLIPAKRLFPAYVDSVFYGSGEISVTAISGPWIGRTIGGNVTGNGTGYFWAKNSAKNVHIDIESKSSKRHIFARKSKSWYDRQIEKLKEYDPDFAKILKKH